MQETDSHTNSVHYALTSRRLLWYFFRYVDGLVASPRPSLTSALTEDISNGFKGEEVIIFVICRDVLGLECYKLIKKIIKGTVPSNQRSACTY